MFMQNRALLRKISLVMSIVFAVVFIAGCGEKNNTADGSDPLNVHSGSPSTGSKGASPTPGNKDSGNPGVPPIGESFTKFMEAKSKAYEILEPLIDKITNGGEAMASLAILPLMTADLTILPLSMLIALPPKGDNVWEGEITMLFNGKGRVELKGEVCTFNMEVAAMGASEGKIVITGEYDTRKDSLKANFTMNGLETTLFEYTASGEGYVSQLYLKGDDGDASLVKNAFDGKSLYAGMTAGSGKPESIYQKDVAGGESFVKSDTLMVVLKEGKGYALIDGKKYE